jgi:hypothetical protein
VGIPTWFQIVFAVLIGLQIPFGCWVVLKIITLEKGLVELRAADKARGRECAERLAWLRGMDTKLDNVADRLAYAGGMLEILVKHSEERKR